MRRQQCHWSTGERTPATRPARWPFAALVLLGLALVPAAARAQTTTVVPSGVHELVENVPSWADPAMLWVTRPTCVTGPDGINGVPGDELRPALITRSATWLPPARVLFSFNPTRPVARCNPYRLLSNVESDATSLYYIDNQAPGGGNALWKRSRDANPSDPSTLLVSYGTAPLTGAEILVFQSYVFVILHGGLDVMVEYDKNTGQLYNNAVELGTQGALRSMEFDGRYLWWINGGALRRDDTTNGAKITAAAGPVDAYMTEGYDEGCSPLGCDPFARVIYSQGRTLYLLDTLPIVYPPDPMYTSPEPNASISQILHEGDKYFFFERRPVGGGFSREDWLFRLPVFGTASLIFGPVNNGGPGFAGLRTSGGYLYFQNRATSELLRLPTDAAAIPVEAIRATGLEVVQSIQGPASPVTLVRGKRTFARLHVRSDDGDYVYGGVTAQLDVSGPGGYLGRLEPANPAGKRLIIRTNPSRLAINDSFLFEIPLAWTEQSPLTFVGTVNPNRVPLENTMADNSQSLTRSFTPSPRLPLVIYKWIYQRNGTRFAGSPYESSDSASVMRRMYPLAQLDASITEPGPGLRWVSYGVFDDEILSRVERTHKDCDKFVDAKKGIDNRNMCAVDYALNRIRAMRAAGEIPTDRYYYAAISQTGVKDEFTRGFAPDGDKIAGGPSNDSNYMSHEVGHTLGRGHPGSGADPVCSGQTGDDAGYPYPRARIGNSTTAADDATALLGFDPAGGGTGVPSLLAASTRGDTMSYCSPYWISDYTFTGILNWLVANPVNGLAAPAASLGASAAPAAAAIAGDWLLAFGGFAPATGVGSFSELRRTSHVAEVPALVPGGQRLELRSAGGTLLASYGFSAEAIEDAGPQDLRSFGLVVPFVAGTRSVRVVEDGTNRILASQAVSASPPSISGVELVGAPNPVSGEVSVAWSASDPDGDLLRFDLLRSRDGGASFEPALLSVPASPAVVDTAAWGGGSAILRVVASDGVQSATADSAPFSVAAKAPVITVTAPTEGLQVEYGQLVSFLAEVKDPQEAPFAPSDIVWSNAYRTLGVGPSIAVANLEVGSNLVTVVARNAAGLSSSASVTVQVGDRLAAPGARIGVVPATLGFDLPGAASEPVAASLALDNTGNGSLTVDATSGAPWLLISGGATQSYVSPTTIPVSVDPSSLPDAATSETTLTLHNRFDPADTVVVPVSVSKGAVFLGVPFADADGDGIWDFADNCAFVPNPDQADRGGVGASTPADGIGDACQCGDVTGDGRITLADVAALQRSLLVPPQATLARPGHCDVGGSVGCSVTDVAILQRALLSPPRAVLQQACVAAP